MSWEEGAELRWANGSEKGIFYYARGTWWFAKQIRDEVLRLEEEFVAYDDDLVLVSSPKTGTTWLKSIILCIKHHGTASSDILEREEAHGAAPCLEVRFEEPLNLFCEEMVRKLERPRFYQTHMPLHNLPKSIRENRCKIVYITRNPKDTIISMANFQFGPPEDRISTGEMTQRFVDGTSMYGPFDRHVREYWDESRLGEEAQNPVCFVQYENLLQDAANQIRRVADFMGKPLSLEEVEEIAERCSIDNLKKAEPNAGASKLFKIDNKVFFRKGKIGNWREEMSDEQSALVDRYVEEKFKKSGIEFTFE